jgi:hypothetical protein
VSFTCYFCGAKPEGVKPKKVVTERRMIICEVSQKEDSKTQLATVSSEVKYETVKEVNACSACALIQGKKKPEIVEVRNEIKEET